MLLTLAARYLARETAPRADQTRCLNYRQPELCRRCIYACPHDAISIDHQVTILDEKCKKCGACAASCPTKCLELPEVNWLKLFNTALKKENLYLGCVKAKEINTNLVVPCLGAIPAEFMAGITVLIDEPFNIDLSPCSDCDNRWALQQLRKQMRRAKIMSDSPILFKARFNKPAEANDTNLLNQTNLAIIKRHGENLADSFRANASSDYPLFSKDNDKGSLKKQLLLTILKDDQESSIRVNSWQIGPECNGCGTCSGICPNRAWNVEHEAGAAHLIHRPALCTTCKLCSQACPVECMSPTSIRLDSTTFYRYLTRSMQTWRCHKCQRVQIGKSKQNDFCSSCKKKYEAGKKFVQDQKRAI